MNGWTSQLVSAASAHVVGLDAVWDALGASWYRALLASGLLVFACCAGWGISQSNSLALVRLVRWWIGRVLWPLLCSRSWLARATTIYVNNMLILCGLLALGRWSWAVIGGTALVGVVMGVAVRTLSGMSELSSVEITGGGLGSWRLQWGMGLNLLEPPAIAIALGLALSREPESFSAAQTWGTFLVVVAPLMLVAAGGESLWMGESAAFQHGSSKKPPPTHDAGTADESHSD